MTRSWSLSLLAILMLVTVPSAAVAQVFNLLGAFEVNDAPGNNIDEGIAVGPTVVLLSNNGSIAMRTKSGALLQSATLARFFDTVRDRSANPFDIRTLFDEDSQRFFALAVERGGPLNCHATPGSCTSNFLLALSITATPASLERTDWHFYSLDATRENDARTEMWADYPSLGVAPGSVVIATQMFPFAAEASADNKVLKIRILDKSTVLSGRTPTWRDLTNPRDPQSGELLRSALQVAHHAGRLRIPLLVTSAQSSCGYVVIGIDNALTAPALVSRVTPSTTSCRQAPDAIQPDTSVTLSAHTGMRSPPTYRKDSLWLARVSGTTGAGGQVTVAELDLSEWPTTPRLKQEGAIGGDGASMFYPALAVDAANNVAVIFGRSSATEFASLYVAGRLDADRQGELRGAFLLKGGAGSFTANSNGRSAVSFGDYFAAAVDPIDGTIWVVGEYVSTPTALGRFAAQLQFISSQ